MRLAVSNIAWEGDEDDRLLRVLVEEGVDELEVAPTRLSPTPTTLSAREAREIRDRFESGGLEVVAMQSLLFGQPELRLFGSPVEREQLHDYLARIITLSGHLGVQRLVFGSPRNRALPEGGTAAAAFAVAVDFFRRIGALAEAAGAIFCIEPNPAVYGCDFIVTTEEGIALVDAVDHPGFGLHLDAAGSTLAGEDLATAVTAAAPRIRHFHASAPQLGELEDEEVDHAAAARALRSTAYPGTVSIEMRSGGSGLNERRVRDAIRLARRHYDGITADGGTGTG